MFAKVRSLSLWSVFTRRTQDAIHESVRGKPLYFGLLAPAFPWPSVHCVQSPLRSASCPVTLLSPFAAVAPCKSPLFTNDSKRERDREKRERESQGVTVSALAIQFQWRLSFAQDRTKDSQATGREEKIHDTGPTKVSLFSCM